MMPTFDMCTGSSRLFHLRSSYLLLITWDKQDKRWPKCLSPLPPHGDLDGSPWFQPGPALAIGAINRVNQHIEDSVSLCLSVSIFPCNSDFEIIKQIKKVTYQLSYTFEEICRLVMEEIEMVQKKNPGKRRSKNSGHDTKRLQRKDLLRIRMV